MLNTGLPPNHISGIRLGAPCGDWPKRNVPRTCAKGTPANPRLLHGSRTRSPDAGVGAEGVVSSTRLVREQTAELPLAAGAGVGCKDRVTRQPAFSRLLGP